LNKIYLLLLVIGLNLSCDRHRKIIDDQTTFIAPIAKEEKQKDSVASTKKGDEKISFIAKIIRILDGDTVEILYEKLTIKVRLEHIDAPEKRGKQPYGNAAKKALSELCFGQTVTISSTGEFDRYGRLIGEIYNNQGLNVNKEMVHLGMAWHFKKYSDDMSYNALEKEARRSKRGLWQEPNAIAPWDFR
jgi:endonuclease YncB( thermonuclease family)